MGRPLIEWQMDAFSKAGVRDVLVVRGYMGGFLEDNYKTIGNPRWHKTNMVVSLLCADRWLREAPCIVSYADITYHFKHLCKLMECDGDIALTYDRDWQNLWQTRMENPLEDAESFKAEKGCLVEIGARPQKLEAVQGQFMGLLKFTPLGWTKVLDYLVHRNSEEVDRLDTTALLSRLLLEGIEIKTVPVVGKWVEIDRQSDITAFEDTLARHAVSGTRWSHDWRWGME